MNNNPYQGQYQAPQNNYQGQPYSYPGYQSQQANPYQYSRPTNPAQTKSGFLTFCFSFVPGAGQMYLNHMKRGVSLSILFFGLWWLSALILDGLWIALPIIWMFSFFDTFNLRGKIAAGTAEPDDFLFHAGDSQIVKDIVARRHTAIGVVLIAMGVWAAYQKFLLPAFWDFCNLWNVQFLYAILDSLPTLIVIAGIIIVGMWLVRGPQQASKGFVAQPEDDIQYYAAEPAEPDMKPAENPLEAAVREEVKAAAQKAVVPQPETAETSDKTPDEADLDEELTPKLTLEDAPDDEAKQ